VHRRTDLGRNEQARCRHCHTILYRDDPRYVNRTLALAVTGIILFVVANLFPVIQIDLTGVSQYMNIPVAVSQLFAHGYYVVGIGVLFMVLIIPMLVLVSYTVVLWSLMHRRNKRIVRNLLILLSRLLPWSMVDVFAISILVALVKLSDSVEIRFGVAFWALVLYVGIDLYLTKARRLGTLWSIYDHIYPRSARTHLPLKMVRCPVCEAVNPDRGGEERCVRCGSQIRPTLSRSLHRSWAFLITALLLYFPANLYPVLRVKNVLYHSESTIIGGIIQLWDEGSYPVAVIILVASVFVPILKFIVLLYLLISVRYPVAGTRRARHRMHAILEWIGPWSMVDVFVVSVLVGLVHYDTFSVLAGPGATAFVLMVFFTMLAAMSFDPRLIDTAAPQRKETEK
jgi:paraquat-inducible protein A